MSRVQSLGLCDRFAADYAGPRPTFKRAARPPRYPPPPPPRPMSPEAAPKTRKPGQPARVPTMPAAEAAKADKAAEVAAKADAKAKASGSAAAAKGGKPRKAKKSKGAKAAEPTAAALPVGRQAGLRRPRGSDTEEVTSEVPSDEENLLHSPAEEVASPVTPLSEQREQKKPKVLDLSNSVFLPLPTGVVRPWHRAQTIRVPAPKRRLGRADLDDVANMIQRLVDCSET